MDVRQRQRLESRALRVDFSTSPPAGLRLLTTAQRKQAHNAANVWKRHHTMGERSTYRCGHACGHWRPRYSAEHPDYFAMNPNGTRKPDQTARAKLCVGNPAVADQIIAERGWLIDSSAYKMW